MDDFININEDQVVDQTGSHLLMEDEAEEDSKMARKYTEKVSEISSYGQKKSSA